jgi:hypothetical protein
MKSKNKRELEKHPAPVETLDSPRQLELDFRAPVLQMVLPDQKTQDFWHATADDSQEFARRIARFSRRMQQCAIVKPDEGRSQKRAAKWPK